VNKATPESIKAAMDYYCEPDPDEPRPTTWTEAKRYSRHVRLKWPCKECGFGLAPAHFEHCSGYDRYENG